MPAPIAHWDRIRENTLAEKDVLTDAHQPGIEAYGDYPPVVHNYSLRNLAPHYELICDALKQGRFRGRSVGPCYHEIVDDNTSPIAPFSGDYGVRVWFDKPVHPHIEYSKVVSMLPQFPDSTRSLLCLEAANYFSDVFPEVISFAEFVQGFTQLGDLLPHVDNISRTVSGGYLTEQFGWENLLSDLSAMRSICETVSRRLAYLRKIRNRGTRMHFVRKLNSDQMDFPFWSDTVCERQRGNRSVLKPRSWSAVFSATCWIYEALDYIDGTIGFIRALTGAFGLNNPVKAFWNLVPGSFVVDWFFHISNHLDHLTRLGPVDGWSVTNVTHTLRLEAFVDVYVEHLGLYGSSSQTQAAGAVRMSTYYRRTGCPADLSSLSPGSLTPSQLLLFIALFHQFGG